MTSLLVNIYRCPLLFRNLTKGNFPFIDNTVEYNGFSPDHHCLHQSGITFIKLWLNSNGIEGFFAFLTIYSAFQQQLKLKCIRRNADTQWRIPLLP